MSIDSLRSSIVALEKHCADLENKRSAHQDRANSAAKAAAGKEAQALKASSPSMRRSHESAAEREGKRHADELKKAADCATKIASARQRIAQRMKGLDSALKQAGQKDVRDAKARRREEARETDKRHRREKDHAREISRISRPEVRHVFVEPPKPEVLCVLYLTASPDAEQPLRVDAEVNLVRQAIRGSKFRDLIDIQHRPAARTQDLLDGINDHRPHVVHFSGHGGAGLLAFDNASLNDPRDDIMRFDTLAELLGATSTPPKLLVMNACSTLVGSEILLEVVPVLIAMAEPVSDLAAGAFATHFYTAIASAQPIGIALRQGRAMLRQMRMDDDADLPQLRCRPDIDPETMTLIAPSGHDLAASNPEDAP